MALMISGSTMAFAAIPASTDVGEQPGTVTANYNEATHTIMVSGQGTIDSHKFRTLLSETIPEAERNATITLEGAPTSALSLPRESGLLFAQWQGLINLPDNLNTSQVEFMHAMFAYTPLANPNVAHWDTSHVTSMAEMFRSAVSATPDTSRWNTSRVTTMESLFFDAKQANPDVSHWDTSHVTDMADMFRGTDKADPDTSGFNTSNVLTMNNMFAFSKVANPDTSGWDTSKVNAVPSMFQEALAANPDVSRWDMSHVTQFTNMFYGAPKANPDVSRWKPTNLLAADSMFENAPLARPDLSKWNTPELYTAQNMLRNTGTAIPENELTDKTMHIDLSSLTLTPYSGAPGVLSYPDVRNTERPVTLTFTKEFAAQYRDASQAPKMELSGDTYGIFTSSGTMLKGSSTSTIQGGNIEDLINELYPLMQDGQKYVIKPIFPPSSSNTTVVHPTPITTKPTIADKTEVKTPEKVEVKDPTALTDDEKQRVIDAVKKANPDLPTDAVITVDDTGKVTITYSDGSTDVIEAVDVVVKAKEIINNNNGDDPVVKPVNKTTWQQVHHKEYTPKTGDEGFAFAPAIALVASVALGGVALLRNRKGFKQK